MNEQNTHNPEQEQPKLSNEVIRRLGGDAVTPLIELVPATHIEVKEVSPQPQLIDVHDIPGHVPSTEVGSSIEYGHVVRDVPMPADPWNRAIGYREAMQKAMRTPAEGVSQPSGLSQETTDRLNGQQ